MAPRPDPTADLHWSDYRGAIHDIFASNANEHPERLCVVETASSESSRRNFTYRQINEASNILAHHLIQAGVQRGEVVMVYAHRGVDLVVAVMGVLKAGATFSVIDPAYPPDRQNIYLDVARPSALIVIEKASREAGKLSDKVRSFISENLKLKTEIPDLLLQDDGELVGGTVNGRDVLDPQTALKGQLPGVLVGPDSTPTLSFTSGSEGRPKGVKGRHFSLAYYFPWMSERFNLSQNDKFTMLSGIAHDPIQRDIFTPLFLGAQLLVPSRADIQHEKLAEWMKHHGATVTHLTPAMGQILVGGASAQFPSLHHAFFVGDILIKRDCRRLQELAPNVNIVNMYGTTETSRAVSYYEIPSRNQDPTYLDGMGEVIPAGHGMKDVQLLVVDRMDRHRLCEVGEIGEIYVRAGGLAEGYLGLDDLTKIKFVDNWFVDPNVWLQKDKEKLQMKGSPELWREFYKGPRDRLYRSGDLGRYTTSGNVECTGRADDQVKIRGFRIELGEIDTHLSNHPLVRENVTLVRKDKDEEPRLVSYIVPEMKLWSQWCKEKDVIEDPSEDSVEGMLKRFRTLRDDAREYLKTKLPAYAVPTVIVPLSRMPLNPNGKIDKPALPFPEPSQLVATALRRKSNAGMPLSPTEHKLSGIWASLLRGVDDSNINADDSFFDLGGHSIIAQQLLLMVRRTWRGVDIPMSHIFRDPTLRGLAAEIDRMVDPIGLRLDNRQVNGKMQQDNDQHYAVDAKGLVLELPQSFPPASLNLSELRTVFVTGTTGFLGAYILRELLSRKNPELRVIAHVRASDHKTAHQRVIDTCKAYGVWDDAWESRLTYAKGDLEKPLLGLGSDLWEQLVNKVDVVIHNGARVHWVLPYASLRNANALSTIQALKMCGKGRPKSFTFVSSTSVLDTRHYIEQSLKGIEVSEDDDLEASRTGLGTGYGQSKWVSEYLVREAGRRGLNGTIIRPGYVTGDSKTGATITDDFLIRLWKGCVQLCSRPSIPRNTINQVPVDHVARVVVAASFHPPKSPLGVTQVTSHPRLRFVDYLGVLETYGYDVPEVPYEDWTRRMEEYVATSSEEGREDHALLPLYHFVTTDLPGNTVAPDLDDRNAAKALGMDRDWSGVDASGGSRVDEDLMGRYLAYLIKIGFMPMPERKGARELPVVDIGEEQRSALGRLAGRGKVA